MTSKTKVIWTLKEFTTILRSRQLNKYDCNLGVSGKRGDGKSTFLFKIFNSFKKEGFKQERHQVYSRDDVLKLLANEKFGFCWDDEAINSGYKRDFQQTGQKDLVKVVTNYRDNYNIYGSALPFFYSLDKDLRELIFVHVHIIERGVGVVLLPLTDQIHASDPWDTKANIKIEQRESARIKKNPNLKFRYHKLTTFAGYIYFGDMTVKQRKKYEDIKKAKREKNFRLEDKTPEMSWRERIYDLLLEGKLTKDGLVQACLGQGEKYTNVLAKLNMMLKNNGEVKTVKDYYRKGTMKSLNSKTKGGINDLVPTLSP